VLPIGPIRSSGTQVKPSPKVKSGKKDKIMYGKMKKKKKPMSMKKMYKGGGMETGGMMKMMKKGGVETRSVKRPSACMKRKK